MQLSSSLLREFAKITNDTPEKKNETVAYGTVVEQEGKIYVQLDGSDILTPVERAMDAITGDRVVVMIKNHQAIITGNITSPASARKTTYIKTIDDTLLLYGLDAVGIRSDSEVGNDTYRAEAIVDTTDEDNPVFQVQIYKIGDSATAKIFRVSYDGGILFNGKRMITPDDYCAQGTATIKKMINGSTIDSVIAPITVPSDYQIINVIVITPPSQSYFEVQGDAMILANNRIQFQVSNSSTNQHTFQIGIQWIALRIGNTIVEPAEIIDLDA